MNTYKGILTGIGFVWSYWMVYKIGKGRGKYDARQEFYENWVQQQRMKEMTAEN